MTAPTGTDISLREPDIADGLPIWEFARSCEIPDVNSPYFYVLWCRDFTSTSVIAEDDYGTCGYMIGYERPESSETLFVLQTVVDSRCRGRGLAARMLDFVVGNRYMYLETTIAPNVASRRKVLVRYGDSRNAKTVQVCILDEGLFQSGHDPETLFRTGPLR